MWKKRENFSISGPSTQGCQPPPPIIKYWELIGREWQIRWNHTPRQMTSFVPKMLADSHRRIQHINSSYSATLLLKLQWHTRIYEETFHVNSSSNNAKHLNFMVRKSSVQEIATLVIIREISDSNLETGRYTYSPKSRVIRESWQHSQQQNETSGGNNFLGLLWEFLVVVWSLRRKMPWPFIKFSQLILSENVLWSVWRICMPVLELTGLKGCLPLICTSLRMFEQCGSFLSFSGILTDVEQPYCQQWSEERWDK